MAGLFAGFLAYKPQHAVLICGVLVVCLGCAPFWASASLAFRPDKPMTQMNDFVGYKTGRQRDFQQSGNREFCWSGQIMEPVDGLAFIGRNPGDQNTYVGTGDSGNGMTHGTIAGMLLTDLIQGRANKRAGLSYSHDPARKSLRGPRQNL